MNLSEFRDETLRRFQEWDLAANLHLPLIKSLTRITGMNVRSWRAFTNRTSQSLLALMLMQAAGIRRAVLHPMLLQRELAAPQTRPA